MPRATSRNDTALHRLANNARSPEYARARMAYHLAQAAWKPLRALDELIVEVERLGCGVNRVILLRAKTARDVGWPYLTDEDGSVWR